jgi:DNA-binding GntR family transcriptional regulator
MERRSPRASGVSAYGVDSLPRRAALSDDVYEALRGLLVSHGIAPGERVSIGAVARELAVSATPVREALARLESEGLVVKQAMKGYTTTPLLTLEELNDLYLLRTLIEPWAAGQAARFATAADRRRLSREVRLAERASHSDPIERFRTQADHDALFHNLVIQLSGSAQVEATFARTHCHLHIYRLHYSKNLASKALAEHRAIAKAIEAGNAETAEDAMREHLRGSVERLRETYK